MSSVEQSESPSKPAQDLLEQYKHYRDDGIVDIKEPIPSQPQHQTHSNQTQNTNKKATQIVKKLMQKTTPKRSCIINKTPSNTQQNKASTHSIGGCNELWWDQMIKEEDKFVNDYKHKVHNIAMMQQYETQKDPSPFNTDNDMNLQQKWDQHLWKESLQKQQQYLDKTEPIKKGKKKKKKVKFAPALITKQRSSELVTDDKTSYKMTLMKEPIKKRASKPQQYGDLVGFFNKKKNKIQRKKKTNVNNPYLDNELMNNIQDFKGENELFEKKFDHKRKEDMIQPTVIASDEFKSMIVPSEEFKSETVKEQKVKPILKKSSKNELESAFNGKVFERKPPDVVYVVDADDGGKEAKQSLFKSSLDGVKAQCVPKISEAKRSLFRKRNDPNYEMNTDNNTEKYPAVITVAEHKGQKKVRFADNLVSKELSISKEKEDIYLLFLDVDGVLNCSYSPSLSRAHILRLKKILNRFKNCKICISSSWRIYKHTRFELLNGLFELGNIDVNNIIIGDTPRIRKDPFKCRAEEIKSYLEHNEYLNDNYNVLKWCAIDDIPLDTINASFNHFMVDHFVRTDATKGITDMDVEKVICIFNGIDKITTKKRLENILENDESNMQLQIINKKKEEIKILFLDIDGVLNYSGFDGLLSIHHLLRLKKIIDLTECRIVLSTSWRRIPTAKEALFRELSSRIGLNINKYVIGSTPVLGSQMKKSLEIYQYLESIKSMYNVISWIAIDDLPLDRIGTKQIKQIFKHHFVKTDVQIGLSDKNVTSAISLLNVS